MTHPFLTRQAKKARKKKAKRKARAVRRFRRQWRDPMAQAFRRAMADPDA